MSNISGMKMSGMAINGKYSAMPADFASLRLDLDFLDSASITFNGSNISQINDASGQVRHFSQATAALQPLWTTGLGATFNSDFLSCASNLINDSVGTFLIVLRFDRTNTVDYLFALGDSAVVDGDDFDFSKLGTGSNNVRSTLRMGTLPGIGSGMTFTDTTTFRIFVFQQDNIYINSVQDTIVLYGSNPLSRWFNQSPTPNRMTIGRAAGSAAAFGLITVKRVSYFNSKLSNGDIVRVVNGLKTYYNI